MRAQRPSPRAAISLALFGLLACLPSLASAQVVLLAPLQGPADAPGHTVPAGANAHRAVRESLHERAFEIREDSTVCPSAECEILIRVSVWELPERTLALVVSLVSRDGTRSADEVVPVGEEQAGARRALERALLLRHEQRGRLRVTSEPRGADVWLGDERVGTTPVSRATRPGAQRLRLVLGERERVARAWVYAAEETRVAVSFEMVAPGREEPLLAANLGVGAGLALVGLAFLISPVLTLATLGECRDEPALPRGCEEGVVFGAQSGILTAFGLGALLAGGLVVAFEPFVVEVVTAPTRAAAGPSRASW